MMKLNYIFAALLCCFSGWNQLNAQCEVTLVPTNATCFASATGSIDLTASGGTGPYTFLWNNSSTTEDLVDLIAGTYCVTVTDALGCTTTTCDVIAQPPPITLLFTVTNIACFGQSNGCIDLNPVGGTGPYTYSWTTGETIEDICNLSSQVYTVMVTDVNGCTKQASILPTQPNPVVVTATSTNVSCYGGNNGSLHATASGGTGVMTFTWAGGYAGANVAGVPAGTYTVTATDANGCTGTASTTITQTPEIIVDGTVTNVSCFGKGDGNIQLLISGGYPGYQIDWYHTPSLTDPPNIFNLWPGLYIVRVYDVYGCTIQKQYTITSPSELTLTAAIEPSVCNNAAGSIDVTVSGGTPGYTYTWSNGANTEDISGLTAGNYAVTVTDANGCTATLTRDIVVIASFSGTVAVEHDTCGQSIGALTMNVSAGGVEPYSYLWSNGETGQTISGLDAGIYTCTISDAVGCTLSGPPVTVGNFTNFNLASDLTAVTCNGGNNGAVDITVSGGVGPYTFLWSNGETTEDLAVLTGGVYTTTITDATGCAGSFLIGIDEPALLEMAGVVSTPGCVNINSGIISLSVSGGLQPYTYIWSSGQTTSVIQGILPGQYSATVTDINGCTVSDLYDMPFSTELFLEAGVVNSTCGESNGEIDLSVFGGAFPYTYDWSFNGPQVIDMDPQDLIGLDAGEYSVTVTSANGCTGEEVFFVSNALPFDLDATIIPDTCGTGVGSIHISLMNGSSPYSFLWSNGANTQDLINLEGGIYSVTIIDDTGCETILTPSLENIASFEIEGIVDIQPCSYNNANININVIGATGPYFYLWSNGSTNESISNVQSGIYTVTVMDGSGCEQYKTFSLSSPLSLQVNLTSSNPTCFDSANGWISALAIGGWAPYSYEWSNNSSLHSPSLSGLSAGTYTVTITEMDGCTVTASVSLTNPPPIPVFNPIIENFCDSTSVTLPIIVAGGGGGQYTAQWSTGATGYKVIIYESGNYSVTLTNSNGCTSVQTIYTEVIPESECAFFSGKVVIDNNNNCINDAEPGLSSWLVSATSPLGTYYGVTQADGSYTIGVPQAGEYLLEAIPPGALWLPCPGLILQAPASLDTVENANLPIQAELYCADIEVQITSSNIRRCFNANSYSVSWCNNGTATAENAYIILSMDALSTPLSSNIPYTNLGSNNFRFDLGNVDPLECGFFNVVFNLSCNAAIGQTICATAHIYPDTICMPANNLWSGASLELTSVCQSDSLHFTIKNVGFGPMTNALDYIVVEDHVMLFTQPVQLGPNESKTVTVPANGSTWHLQIPQEPFHPGNSMPALTIEGCTTGTVFSTGFVTQYAQNEADTWIDIDCKEVTGSYDPNDKTGYPKGYGPAHYIDKDVPIDYVIRFQNTGNDTAFTVRIVDTLSQWLNPSSIRPGASSHPYKFDLTGEGIASFTFENILLPDSNINEVASHGYVQFSILLDEDTPLETAIENTAAIYFDYNDPIFTNTTTHRLGDHFITVGLWTPEKPEYEVVVSPNPSHGNARITVKGLHQTTGLQLEVFGVDGRKVLEQKGNSATFNLSGSSLGAGVYWFRIVQNGVLVGNGKLVVKE